MADVAFVPPDILHALDVGSSGILQVAVAQLGNLPLFGFPELEDLHRILPLGGFPELLDEYEPSDSDPDSDLDCALYP